MKDLYAQSEYLEFINSMIIQEFGKKAVITEIHLLKTGDGNILFYILTEEGFHFLVNIMGKKIQDDAVMYWIENINHAGKIDQLFVARDLFVLTFSRGEKYNNEYLSYFYHYGNKYPAIRFVTEEIYPNYIKMLEKNYKRYDMKLPEHLL